MSPPESLCVLETAAAESKKLDHVGSFLARLSLAPPNDFGDLLHLFQVGNVSVRRRNLFKMANEIQLKVPGVGENLHNSAECFQKLVATVAAHATLFQISYWQSTTLSSLPTKPHPSVLPCPEHALALALQP